MKSNVSDLLRLMDCIYRDATMKCTAEVSDLRDLETIRSRVKSEGISFLTITLPQFASDFERSISDGVIDSKAFRSFRKAQAIPAFLQGMLSQLFDRETGRMYDKSNPIYNGVGSKVRSIYVEAIREICLAFKKIEIPCTPERTSAALDSFVNLEQSFENFQLQTDEIADFQAVSRVLWTPIIGSFELDDVVPKHGPGATAEGVSGNQKYLWQRWHDRLEPYFPLVGLGYPMGAFPESEELKIVSIMSMEQEQPVKVTPVPKTLKSPRIIAIEPCCMQYAQQGIRDWLYNQIESHWLTKGHVNFRDQSVNQELALVSSSTGQFATIDLSDASDRVPRDLALEMFSMHPDLQAAVESCRSNSAELPDGRIISPLRKFASMGSALCFPVEAMYFYTICVVALLKVQNLPATLRNIFHVSRGVYVYGDDIVVPTTNAAAVLDYLQKYNCKVNSNKTFTSGSFRESCGIDAFEGESVTPTYIRQMRPENRHKAAEIVSWVATSNLFYKKGYWMTAEFMRNCIDSLIGPLPYVSETSPVLGYTSYLGLRSTEGNLRWNKDLHRLEIKAYVPSPVFRTGILVGYSALSKSLKELDRANNPEFPLPREGSSTYGNQWVDGRNTPFFPKDPKHLERYARHGAVALKRRWTAALT